MTETFCVCNKCGRNVKTHRDVIGCLCKDCCNELSSISKGVNQKQADMAQEVWSAWLHDYEMNNPFYYLTFIPDEHLKSMSEMYGCVEFRDNCAPLSKLDATIFEAIKRELERRENG